MGNLARGVLFRMPARDVIHYSRSPALTNLMHGQVPATIPKLLWLWSCIHPNGWDHYFLLTKHWPSGRDSTSTWIMHVDTRRAILNSVLWHILVFFSKISAPKRESCGNWEVHLGEREINKLMYSDCRGRLQHKGVFQFRAKCRENRASRMLVFVCLFFLTETSNAENKATVYHSSR